MSQPRIERTFTLTRPITGSDLIIHTEAFVKSRNTPPTKTYHFRKDLDFDDGRSRRYWIGQTSPYPLSDVLVVGNDGSIDPACEYDRITVRHHRFGGPGLSYMVAVTNEEAAVSLAVMGFASSFQKYLSQL